MEPTGQLSSRFVKCRISYESAGVWKRGAWDGGVSVDAAPYALAGPDADIIEGDTLEWRGGRYLVGAVTKPGAGGGAVCLQAALTRLADA